MEKLIKLNSELLTARKEKNVLAKNLLSTFKGLYELETKKSKPEGNVTIEAIAKDDLCDFLISKYKLDIKAEWKEFKKSKD